MNLKHITLNKLIFYVVATITSLILIQTLVFQLNMVSGIVFVTYQLFLILIPGIAFLLLIGHKLYSDIEVIGIGYVVGYCLNIAMYYLVVFLDMLNRIFFVAVIIGCLSLVVVLKKGKSRTYKCDSDGRIICGIFISVLFLFQLVVYVSVNFIPNASGEYNAYYTDLLYWMGNTVSLSKGYPVINFRNYPEIFNYHFFSSMQIAVMSLITKISVIHLSFYYAMIQPIILLVFGSYLALKNHSTHDTCKWPLISGICLILCVTGFDSYAIVTYVSHMYFAPFGFDYGIGVVLFLVYFMSCIIKEDLNWSAVGIIWILFAVLCGVKGPSAAIVLIGFGTLSLYWLWKREFKKVFLYGVTILVIFLLIYLFVTNTTGYSGKSLTESISVNNIQGEEVKTIATLIYEWTINFLKRTICANPVLYILSLISLVHCILAKKWDMVDTLLLVMMICGVVLTTQIQLNGHSEMYFVMTIYPICGIFIYRKLLIYLAGKSNFYSRIARWIMGILLIFGMLCLLWVSSSHIRLGFENYLSRGENLESFRPGFAKANLTYEQLEACNYIKKYSDENDKILTIMTPEQQELYGYGYGIKYNINGICAERFEYDLPYELVQQCTQQTRELLIEKGIVYIIVDIETANELLLEDIGKLEYANNRYKIYCIG